MPLEIHNVYFMTTDGWTRSSAESWLQQHHYKIKKKDPHHVGNELRYNQMPKQKFSRFVTKILPNGVHLIFGERITAK